MAHGRCHCSRSQPACRDDTVGTTRRRSAAESRSPASSIPAARAIFFWPQASLTRLWRPHASRAVRLTARCEAARGAKACAQGIEQFLCGRVLRPQDRCGVIRGDQIGAAGVAKRCGTRPRNRLAASEQSVQGRGAQRDNDARRDQLDLLREPVVTRGNLRLCGRLVRDAPDLRKTSSQCPSADLAALRSRRCRARARYPGRLSVVAGGCLGSDPRSASTTAIPSNRLAANASAENASK